jgi:Peptidase family M28/WD40-like Beta Propeller Repeat
MKFRALLLTLSLAGAVVLTAGSTPGDQAGAAVPPETRWLRAADAWEAGRYPVALEDLRALMRSSAAAEYLERVALLTGELYVTTDITANGRNPRISADGRYVSYETGAAPRVVTKLVRVEGGLATEIADLPATGVSFAPAGTRVLYLRPKQAAEFASAVKAYDEAATPPDRAAVQTTLDYLQSKGDVVIRDLSNGAERVVPTGSLLKAAPAFSSDGQSVIFLGADEQDLSRSDIYVAGQSGAPARVTDQPGHKANLIVAAKGGGLLYSVATVAPFRVPGPGGAGREGGGRGAGGGGGGRGGGAPAGAPGGAGAPQAPAGPNPCGGRGGGSAAFGVVDLASKTSRVISGTGPAISADGSTVAWLSRNGDVCDLKSSPVTTDAAKTVRAERRMDAPALSPDGKQIAYQLMTHTDWEIYVTDQSGNTRRLTRDIQHDLLPRFLADGKLLGLMGEARHRRSHLYDVATGTRQRLFANNTIRTISPEYLWVPSADGSRLLVQADRDGDTVSVERGVSVVDLTRKVTAADVLARLDRQLAEENDLRQRMTKAFQPVEKLAREVVERAAVNRVYAYEKALFDFDSKHITQPGNAKAIDYLEKTYRSFGYDPQIQWFTPGQLKASGGRTGNVIATLRGTENPELIYVVSSHFDSVAGGPGADDDTSGTAALLEAARILQPNPLPVTVVFASFTGEEAGLLGSTEFVGRAGEQKWNVVGALNNDMIGWGGESGRMDNTIRYSNAGIRDIQHGAAFLFTTLVLYDAKYYQGTDAAAFYRAWGDIVGGIGSYPVLANPNYHQPTDFLETMNHRQIVETAKVTAATLVYLASSPSRLKDLKAARTGSGVELTWQPSPEAGVKSYVIAYGPAANPMKDRLTVTSPRATLPAVPAGTHVAVKAINARGLEGWDWVRTVLQ